MACDFIEQAVPGVRSLQPYQPGLAANTLAREQGVRQAIKLASNENPLGLSPKAAQAIQQALPELPLYPDANGFALKQAVAAHYQLEIAQLTLGNGSNDVLELIARTFVAPDDGVIYSEYGFVVYPLLAQATCAKAVEVPACHWGHDLDAMLAAIDADTKLIFIANPNNPTGTWLESAELEAFLQQVPEHVLVVLDEAYTEYVAQPGFPDGLQLLARYPNLIVTRTFSKAFGLAGLRAGFAVASVEIADLLNRARQPFNMNALAQAAACAVLDDPDYLQQTIRVNRQGMQQLTQGLDQLGVSYIPSAGNFVTAAFGTQTADVYQALLQRGIIVRPLANYRMNHHLRISIGLPTQNQALLDALAEVLDAL